MQSCKVKLKGTLKLSDGSYLTKGHVFTGPLKEMPEEIQKMVEKKHTVLEVTKIQESVKEAPVKETAPEKKVVKRTIKKSGSVKE